MQRLPSLKPAVRPFIKYRPVQKEIPDLETTIFRGEQLVVGGFY